MKTIYTIQISPKARKSVIDRAIYIQEQGNPFAAASYLSGVYAFITKHLSHNPYIYRCRDDIRNGLRIAFYKKTTAIIYGIDEVNKIVIITNIYHTSENYASKI